MASTDTTPLPAPVMAVVAARVGEFEGELEEAEREGEGCAITDAIVGRPPLHNFCVH